MVMYFALNASVHIDQVYKLIMVQNFIWNRFPIEARIAQLV
jgi:hypothetical protein